MKEIIKLILKFHFTIIFILLEIISFSLIVHKNEYQRAIFSQHASSLFGSISSDVTDVKEYFRLREINQTLAYENVRLKNQLEEYVVWKDSISKGIVVQDSLPVYEYLNAKLVNATFNRMENYLTLNRGRRNGLQLEMAVCSPDGVVGLIKDLSENYAIVLPLINLKSHVSAKIKKNNYYGSLQWDGTDCHYSYLNDIPYHVKVYEGDTIMTSELSEIFPENQIIGFVESIDNASVNFLKIKVKLAVDFQRLSNVYVVMNKKKDEKKRLEADNYHE